ncbi:hypothetical protein NQ314_008438 [Rhamnusium bicolor]|uniref:Uncharacterized protein n=1 Tax=Rhamnusium bicolor TaxID=1586634 RepID=A0AAV8Y9Y4_9CUCU|nr:hypothetical protein NQ314_008438 [Rhamnusium bicolor]
MWSSKPRNINEKVAVIELENRKVLPEVVEKGALNATRELSRRGVAKTQEPKHQKLPHFAKITNDVHFFF